PVTKRICWIPFETSSSTTYWTMGLRPTGSISLGCDLVAGSRRVPRPATGTTAISMSMRFCLSCLVNSRFESSEHLHRRFVVIGQDLHQQHRPAPGVRIDPEVRVEDAAPARTAGAAHAVAGRRHLDLKP